VYLQKGTLDAAAAHLKMTRQNVQQLLKAGNKIGACRYTKDWKTCDLIPLLPDALASSQSWLEVGRKLGVSYLIIRKLCRQLELPNDQRDLFLRNRKAKMLRQAQDMMQILHTPLFNTTILHRQSGSVGHALAVRLNRHFGSIQEVRKALGLPPISLAPIKRAKGGSAEQAYLKQFPHPPVSL